MHYSHLAATVSASLTRMNGTHIANRPEDTTLAFNLSRALQCSDDVEYDEEAARKDRNEKLCAAYGMSSAAADKPFAFSGGVAIIPIHGTLINRFGGYWYGYITGYNFIRSQMNAALTDPDVQAIVYDVNSNGGEAAGCFELASEIMESRKKKRCMAVVDSNCYSAAYALASAAETVAVTPSGGAGSIGVYSMHVDMSKMLENAGIKVTLIASGEHKVEGNPYEPLSDDAKSEKQAGVDYVRQVFVDHVAAARGMDPKTVYDTEGLCYNAEDALAIGLIDSIATPSAAVSEFINGPVGSIETGANAMPYTEEQMSAARQESAAAERTRISSIIGCEAAQGRQKLATHIAFNTQMSAEDAAGMLAASALESTASAPVNREKANANGSDSPFNAVMNGADHPNASVDSDADPQAEKDGLGEAMQLVAGANYTK